MQHRLLLALLVILGLAAGVFLFQSNYTGLCMATGKRLSADGYIRLAVQKVVTQSQYGLPGDIRYASVDEFLRMNTNCCDVAFAGEDFVDERLERFVGTFGVTVDVRYRRRWCASENANSETFWVSSCGEVRSTAPSVFLNRSYEFRDLGRGDLGSRACEGAP